MSTVGRWILSGYPQSAVRLNRRYVGGIVARRPEFIVSHAMVLLCTIVVRNCERKAQLEGAYLSRPLISGFSAQMFGSTVTLSEGAKPCVFEWELVVKNTSYPIGSSRWNKLVGNLAKSIDAQNDCRGDYAAFLPN
jgi:hypothetical protein